VAALAFAVKGAWHELQTMQFLSAPAWVVYVLIALIVGSLWLASRSQTKIALIDVAVLTQDKANYPLKCRAKMRNESGKCIDVQMSRFVEQSVTLKKFESSALQVKILTDCVPPQLAVDRIAVLPDQEFQGCVGIDEKKFDQDTVKRLKGSLGKLVLRVNGKPSELQL
jgi:hypothetical protein